MPRKIEHDYFTSVPRGSNHVDWTQMTPEQSRARLSHNESVHTEKLRSTQREAAKSRR